MATDGRGKVAGNGDFEVDFTVLPVGHSAMSPAEIKGFQEMADDEKSQPLASLTGVARFPGTPQVFIDLYSKASFTESVAEVAVPDVENLGDDFPALATAEARFSRWWKFFVNVEVVDEQDGNPFASSFYQDLQRLFSRTVT